LRPFADALTGLVEEIRYFIVAIGIELGVGADICAEDFQVA
jgi:hypothetical protein